MREKNQFAKTRPVDDPYEVWENPQGWTWNVLKKYQLERNEGQYARWFCAVKSPMTYGEWEYGDVYKSEIMEYAVRTDIDYDDNRPSDDRGTMFSLEKFKSEVDDEWLLNELGL